MTKLGGQMSFHTLFLALILFSGQALASELTVYRWIDKNSVVHFSQHQPIGDEYTQYLVSNQSKMISRADVNKNPQNISSMDIISQQSTQSVTPTINTLKKCQEAKENVSMLITFNKIQYTDDDGNKQVLTIQEKQQQLAINKKRTEIYCAPITGK
jgi:hypothetical protein